MENSQASTSGVNKETNLPHAIGVFEETVIKPTLEATIKVRRRKRGKAFVAEDLLIEIRFGKKSASQNLPLMACLISVYEVLMTLVRKLRNYFDNGKRRLCFFSAQAPAMTSPIFSGGQSLFEEKIERIVQSILRPLFVFLVSNSELDLNAGLQIPFLR